MNLHLPPLRFAPAPSPAMDDRLQLLTRREREVALLILEARSTKQIAQALGLSPRTVETYRGRLFDKLDVHGATELALLVAASPNLAAPDSLAGDLATRHGLEGLATKPRRSFAAGSSIVDGLEYASHPIDGAINVFMMWNRQGEPSGYLIVPDELACQLRADAYPPFDIANPLAFALSYGFCLSLETGFKLQVTGDRDVWNMARGETPRTSASRLVLA